MTPARSLRSRSVSLAGLLVVLLVSACSSFQAAPPASQEEREAYGSALAAVVDDPEGTRRALEGFLERYPQSPLADDALMRLAEIAQGRGDTATALRTYQTVESQHPGGDQVDAARVEIARLELAAGNREAAGAAITRARLSRLSSAELRVAYRVLADVAEAPEEKLRWLGRVRGAETDEEAVGRLDVEIDDLMVQMDSSQLVAAAEQIGREVPAGRTWLEASSRALDAGDLERARDWLDEAARLPLAPAYEARLTSVGERLRLREAGPAPDVDLPTFAEVQGASGPRTEGAVGTLGVVLPLSGKFASFGEESLQGILLAAGVFGADGTSPRIRVLIRDSGGRPERAAAAVRDLADEGVVAIVGPLLSGECEAAASAAESAGVPLLALSAREEVSAARPHVFRVRTMPDEEVVALVDHAIGSLGAQRFAILYPRDSYGRGLRRLFWNAVEERGGEVVGVASYAPDATDFAEPIRKLVGYTLLTPEEKEVLKERDDMERRARRLPPEEAAELRLEAKALTGPDEEPLPPIVDFDALFIPESHEKVVLITPQLAFHEAVGMTLLGPNGWYHDDLVPIAREHVEGALFTAHFYSESELPFVREFAGRYESAYAEAPDALAAQAYDATNLVLVQLADGSESRGDVRDGVLDVEGYAGVTGVLTMRSDGNARKRPFLLAVERGRIKQVGVE
ncbi:MAG: penicillin-binding protein activator [Myxococcota bacterium]|nr:penicillin-binding protein activator [Myxococcota bacterium]